ncbi:MAG: hypothetical protein IKG85_08595 [Clostridia bacterium]|nr:hypothetical protein [Clostridia bacterium]
MKRIIAVILLAAMLAALAACTGKNTEYDPEGYKALLDNAIKLPSEYSDELFEKVCFPGETSYFVDYYKNEKNDDYLRLIREDYGKIADHYAEVYGEDWKLSYVINEAQVKDAEGIEQYKAFDSFYFKTYGVNVDRIQAVTFAKVTVSISGSKDSNSKEKTVQCFCVDGVWYSFYAKRLGVNL